MSVDLSKQSVFLCHGSEARSLSTHTHTHTYTQHSAGTSPQAIPPVHPLLPLPLCLSFLIIFHFFCVQFPPHTALNCARALFRFSFIKRSARVVHTRLHPALVSLRAGVGGKSVCVFFFFFSRCIRASPRVEIDEMCCG